MLPHRNRDIIVDHIASSFVLHNFLILNGEQLLPVSTKISQIRIVHVAFVTIGCHIFRRRSLEGLLMMMKFWVGKNLKMKMLSMKN